MLRWRVAVVLLLGTLVGWPLLMPFLDLLAEPCAWSAWRDTARILPLMENTASLVAGVLLVDIPLGVFLAILLYRSDLPGRVFLRQVVVVSLFVPLPLLTSAWQAALGSGGWLGPANASWPWITGLRAAIWIHAIAGLPWVIWLVGQGLCWVEPEAEEDARLATGPWRVLWRVTLPRARGRFWRPWRGSALLSAHEITVTDLTQVRTFAEEVYTQFVLPDPGAGSSPELGVARAVAVTLPGTWAVALALAIAAWRWERAVPPLGSAPDPRPLIRLRAARPAAAAGVGLAVGLLLAVPVGSLLWKLGLHGYPGVVARHRGTISGSGGSCPCRIDRRQHCGRGRGGTSGGRSGVAQLLARPRFADRADRCDGSRRLGLGNAGTGRRRRLEVGH